MTLLHPRPIEAVY